MLTKDQEYVINWDKIKTVKDIIRILRMMGMTVTPKTDDEVIIYSLIEDLLLEVKDENTEQQKKG